MYNMLEDEYMMWNLSEPHSDMDTSEDTFGVTTQKRIMFWSCSEQVMWRCVVGYEMKWSSYEMVFYCVAMDYTCYWICNHLVTIQHPTQKEEIRGQILTHS